MPSSRAAANASSTPGRSTPGRAIHMANTNGKPVHRRPLFAQVPLELEAAAGRAACPGRRSTAPRRPARRRATRRWATAGVSGETPNRSFNRMRANAALVREPSSNAKRAHALDGHAAVELHASHRRRRRRCRRRRRSHSPAGGRIRSTGSSPRRAGPQPAHRPAGWAGRSTISACGASPASENTKRPRIQIRHRAHADPARPADSASFPHCSLARKTSQNIHYTSPRGQRKRGRPISRARRETVSANLPFGGRRGSQLCIVQAASRRALVAAPRRERRWQCSCHRQVAHPIIASAVIFGTSRLRHFDRPPPAKATVDRPLSICECHGSHLQRTTRQPRPTTVSPPRSIGSSG